MENDICDSLEEGEIDDGDNDDLDDIYTPLERPIVPAPHPVVTEPSDLSDRYDSDSSSDSDSDQNRPKIRRQRKKNRPSTPVNKRKVNNSWISEATAEILSDKLNNCKVEKNVFCTRDVESYNPGGIIEKKVMEKMLPASSTKEPSNKRHRSGKAVSLKRKQFNDNRLEVERASRLLLPLVKTVNDSEEDLARDISNKLMEEKEAVIYSVIQVIGKQKAINLFEETVSIEENGGLLILNGTRRRTPGGVFFYLLKISPDIKQEQISEIFSNDRRETGKSIKKLKAMKRKEAINKEDFKLLLSRAEAAILKKKEKSETKDEESEESKNPPPSPATDGKDNSSDAEELENSPVLELCSTPSPEPALPTDDAMDV